MSGGHYEYKYFKLNELADDIEGDFVNDGKYQATDYGTNDTSFHLGDRPTKEYDRIGDATPEQRIEILKEVKNLIDDLRKCSFRAKELEWYMGGDTGAESYLKRLKEGKNKNK